MKTFIFFIVGSVLATSITTYYFTGRLPLKLANSTASESIEVASHDSLEAHADKHSDPNYVCPMHPQIIQGEEGSCPICGMDLVLKEAPQVSATSPGEKKILYWVAPMDANYRRDEPGQSPMGMDLVPVYDEGQSNSDDEFPKVTIRANTAQNMGIRLQKVRKSSMSRTIQSIGRVLYNEDTVTHVHPRASGWVEKVKVKAEGDPVKQGQVLLEYYSPDIVAAQQDYLISKKSGKLYSGAKSSTLIKSATLKLKLLDVPNFVIKKLDRSGKPSSRIPVLSPQKGVVIEMGIRDGMYVTPASQMYSIADLSSVWVVVDVFEHQMNWVNAGDEAVMTIDGLTESEWKGSVDYIYPELDKITRTLRVRLKFDNSDNKLKPNMFSKVIIATDEKETLNIPADAIIYYADSPRVIKRIDETTFQPVEVSLGIRTDGIVEIVDGLDIDDEIVVSGQFMIDSESNLQASFRRLTE